jgi:hypothetical protein
LFVTQLAWIQVVTKYLKIGQFSKNLTLTQKQKIVRRVELFMIRDGEFYRHEHDN